MSHFFFTWGQAGFSSSFGHIFSLLSFPPKMSLTLAAFTSHFWAVGVCFTVRPSPTFWCTGASVRTVVFFFFFCKHDSISWESQSVGVQPWTVYSVGESHPNDAWKPVRLVSPRQTLEKERRDGETSATWTAECNRGLSASVNLVSAAWRDIKPSRTFNRDL